MNATKKTSLMAVVAVTATLTLAGAASADLIYTGFDYGQPGLDGGSSPNDIGFAGDWTGNDYGLDGTSLPYPAGVTLGQQPGKVADSSSNDSRRELAHTLDLTSNATWYMSYLSSTAQTSATNIWLMSGSQRQWSFDFGGSTFQGQVATFDGNNAYSRSYDGVNKIGGEVYLFVVKLEANGSAGATGSMAVYQVGVDSVPATEPAVWPVSHTEPVANTVTLDHISIQGSNSFEFDELRIGTTYASVLVPEPASVALLGLGGLMMLRRGRRA